MLKALQPGSSSLTQVPWNIFSLSMASFLKRTAYASFVPSALVDRFFYVGKYIPTLRRFLD
jgi:hypothetical protein